MIAKKKKLEPVEMDVETMAKRARVMLDKPAKAKKAKAETASPKASAKPKTAVRQESKTTTGKSLKKNNIPASTATKGKKTAPTRDVAAAPKKAKAVAAKVTKPAAKVEVKKGKASVLSVSKPKSKVIEAKIEKSAKAADKVAPATKSKLKPAKEAKVHLAPAKVEKPVSKSKKEVLAAKVKTEAKVSAPKAADAKVKVAKAQSAVSAAKLEVKAPAGKAARGKAGAVEPVAPAVEVVVNKQGKAKVSPQKEETATPAKGGNGLKSPSATGRKEGAVKGPDLKKQTSAAAKPAIKKRELNPNMRICYRCSQPYEPLGKEYLCPVCEEPAKNRWSQLFGDEDPYSPQPTIRTNKIARIIPRKSFALEGEEADPLIGEGDKAATQDDDE